MAKFDTYFTRTTATVLMEVTPEGFEFYDYGNKNERYKIHKSCGGRQYYESRSGCNGEGYITDLGKLIPVGIYRTDRVNNQDQYWEKIQDGVEILIPYYFGVQYNEEPVVIRKNGNTIIYCNFENLKEILWYILENKPFYKKPKKMEKNFFDTKSYDSYPMELTFYNFFSGKFRNPWEFMIDRLIDFEIEEIFMEREVCYLYKKLNIISRNNRFFKTIRIAGKYYAIEELEEDPTKTGTELPSGFKWFEFSNEYKIITRMLENKVQVIFWSDILYAKIARRIANELTPNAKEEKNLVEYLLEGNEQQIIQEEFFCKIHYLMGAEKKFINQMKKDVSKRIRKEFDEIIFSK